MALIIKCHNAFFDEHGTHEGSDLVAVGGLVDSYDAWVRAESGMGSNPQEQEDRSAVSHYRLHGAASALELARL